MVGRTFAVGDIHGDFNALERLLGQLPRLDSADTLLFLGDYLDRGPDSVAVVELLRHELPRRLDVRLVTLRGNHEDAWLRVIRQGGWLEFTLPAGNGCLATLHSFLGRPPNLEEGVEEEELMPLHRGSFFPPEVVEWLEELPYWYEDEHAIYVHAGLVRDGERWTHPSETAEPSRLLWVRSTDFWKGYRGKLVVVGHTATRSLPQEYSSYTPGDPTDLWAGPAVLALDTGHGPDGFLTALELPALRVYESREG